MYRKFAQFSLFPNDHFGKKCLWVLSKSCPDISEYKSSCFLFSRFFNLFRFQFSFLSFSILHPIPSTPTMTSVPALHTHKPIPLMIIFQLLSPSKFSYFILFSVPLSRFYFQCQWTADPPQERTYHSLLSYSFGEVFNCNLFIWMHIFLCPLFLICTLTLHVHEQKLIDSFYYDLFS